MAVYPEILESKNGEISKWAIGADDKNLDTLFSGWRTSSQSFHVSGHIEDPIPNLKTSDIGKALNGKWEVWLDGNQYGTVTFKGETYLNIEKENIKEKELENYVKNQYGDDERDSIVGDDSYDADHYNDIFQVEKIIFKKPTKNQSTETVQKTKEKISKASNGALLGAAIGITGLTALAYKVTR